ncbi:SdpA family antimicrobial peptide system protein [Paenibacillus sp. NPDC057934]|uniref:SdpA family antimicrobial peptide system protein n=1 Tax=Paenibacillus sp. NPDC057934 TaxID=3346282 RepID=UPI0036D8EE72
MSKSNLRMLTFFLTSMLLVCLFFFSLLNAIPENVMNIKSSKNVFLKIFPQGWSFFSKSPRDEEFLILDTNYQSAVNWPNNSARNLFGINRNGRAQGIEAGVLAYQVKKKWSTCEENLNKCIKKTEDVVKVNNPSPNPTLCGRYIIVRREPVPWAWANIVSSSDQPSSFVEVEAKCSIN